MEISQALSDTYHIYNRGSHIQKYGNAWFQWKYGILEEKCVNKKNDIKLRLIDHVILNPVVSVELWESIY